MPKAKPKKKASAKKKARKPLVTVPHDRPIHISFLLDETGSMQACASNAISGFNEYIGNMQREKVPVQMTLCTFNSERKNIRYADEPIAKIEPLSGKTYKPDAMTPLLDSVDVIIKRTEETEEKAKKEGKDLAILFVILTDGLENASKEFHQKQIRDLIEKKQKGGWTFVYLGANQDAWDIGRRMGIVGGATMSYVPTAVGQIIGNTLSQATVAYSHTVRTGGTIGSPNFWSNAGISSDDDKKKKDKNRLPTT